MTLNFHQSLTMVLWPKYGIFSKVITQEIFTILLKIWKKICKFSAILTKRILSLEKLIVDSDKSSTISQSKRLWAHQDNWPLSLTYLSSYRSSTSLMLVKSKMNSMFSKTFIRVIGLWVSLLWFAWCNSPLLNSEVLQSIAVKKD